ncbi:MAG: hypothetical protein R3B70_05920 [Polyangiaceae bacterium]
MTAPTDTDAAPPADPPPLSAEPAKPAKPGVLGWLKRYGKWLLLVMGVIAVTLLVRETGPKRVGEVLLGAGAHLPLVIALEAAWISMDTFAVRALLGEHGKKAPAKLYARSGLVAYSIMVLLPAGRAGGEVARAALLGPHVGGARAGAAAARINGVTLLANALISIPCFIAIAQVVGASDKLSLAVLGNAVVTAFLGLGILIVTKRSSIGGFLGKRFRSMVHWGPAFDEALREMPAIPVRAIVLCFFGRFLQMVQYAVILHAVGGALTLSSGLVTQGIHLVGAALGDMVPNQVGFNEGAYRLFAEALGLARDPARAVSIALVARLAQFFLAGACLLVTSLWKSRAAATPPAEPASAPAEG